MRIQVDAPTHFDHEKEYDFEFVTQDPEGWVPDPHKLVTGEQLESMKNLKVIATPSTGTNHIPLDLCNERNIDVLALNIDSKRLYDIKASSEFTFMLILATLKNLETGYVMARSGMWHEHEDALRGNELCGKRVGFVGYGRIGKNVAKWCGSFMCYVAYHDPYMEHSFTLEEIFTESHIVVICCSLTEETTGMITADHINMMKEGAVLINTSRGEVLKESEVAQALLKRPDIRVGVDVVSGESTGAHSPLLDMPGQVSVTPHMAGTTVESQEKAARIALEGLQNYST